MLLCKGTTWANEMNFSMKHAPSAGSIDRPVDLQSNAVLLCNGCPREWFGIVDVKNNPQLTLLILVIKIFQHLNNNNLYAEGAE